MKPKRKRQNSRRGQATDNQYPKHLAWVRKRYACLVDNEKCLGYTQTHHVNRNHDDRCVVPLCTGHHTQIHAEGRDTFGGKFNLIHAKMEKTAADLWMESPHGKKARREEEQARRERDGDTLLAG